MLNFFRTLGKILILISFFPLSGMTQEVYQPPKGFYFSPPRPFYQRPPYRKKSLQEEWVPESLIEEFQDRYDEKIGPVESSFVNKKFIPTGSFLIGLNQEYLNTYIESQEIQEHGIYMFGRVLEYNLDQYLRTNHRLKSIYIVKKRLTEAEIDVGAEEKVQIKAAAAGGRLITAWEPRFAKFYIYIDVFTGNAGEVTYAIEKPHIFGDWEFKFLLTQIDGIIKGILKRPLGKNWSVSVTSSSFTHLTGTSDRESIHLLGLAYHD